MSRFTKTLFLLMFPVAFAVLLFTACGDDDDDDNDNDDAADDDTILDDDDDDNDDDDDDSTVYFESDFEDYDLGLLDDIDNPDDYVWSGWGQDGGSSEIIDLGKMGDGHALEIKGTGTDFMAGAYYNFETLDQHFNLTFDAFFTVGSGVLLSVTGYNDYFDDPCESAVELYIHDYSMTGSVHGFEGESVSCSANLVNYWHSIRISIDTSSETYDVYVDGNLTDCRDVPFYLPGHEGLFALSLFSYSSLSYDETLQIAFDNFKATY